MTKRSWNIDSLALIFSFIVVAQLLSYVIPHGEFEREPYPDNPNPDNGCLRDLRIGPARRTKLRLSRGISCLRFQKAWKKRKTSYS